MARNTCLPRVAQSLVVPLHSNNSWAAAGSRQTLHFQNIVIPEALHLKTMIIKLDPINTRSIHTCILIASWMLAANKWMSSIKYQVLIFGLSFSFPKLNTTLPFQSILCYTERRSLSITHSFKNKILAFPVVCCYQLQQNPALAHTQVTARLCCVKAICPLYRYLCHQLLNDSSFLGADM